MEEGSPRARASALAAVSVVGALAALRGAGGGYFLADDWLVLAHARQFGLGNLHHAFAAGEGQWPYRPLATLLWAAEWNLFGLEPAGYRVVKAATLALSAFLLGTLARRLARSCPIGLLAAALFVFQPMGSAPWIWISANHENLLLGFYLLAAIALDRRVREGKGLVPLVLAGAGALLSKETGATFPGIALAHAFLVAAPGRERRRALGATAVSTALVALYLALRAAFDALPSPGNALRSPLLDTLGGLTTGPLARLVAPVSATANPAWVAPAFGLALAALAARWLLARAPRGRIVLFGLSFVPVAMAPLAPFWNAYGPEMWEGLFAAHYLLLPAAGFCLALAAIVGAPARPAGHGLRVAIALAIVALFAITLRRNHGPWIEAGEISRALARGIRERVPDPDPDRPVVVALVGRPLWHRGVLVSPDPSVLVEIAFEKGLDFPPYPTGRGIGTGAIAEYLAALERAWPYRVVLYANRARALADAEAAIRRGEPMDGLVPLEWIAHRRSLEPLPLPR